MITLEGQLRQLLEEIKYRRGFPPRKRIEVIRNDLTVQGLGRSGALVEAVAEEYLEVVERILDEFTEIVLDKRSELGLATEGDLQSVIWQAYNDLFNTARGLALNDLGESSGAYDSLAMAAIDNRRTPIWQHLERTIKLRPLHETASPVAKEREQKFGILWSANQATTDFETWAAEARQWNNPVSLLFIDLDHFRTFNEQYSHTKVDETILPEAQKILAKHAQGRGEAYRYGGEEFLVILPNHDASEAEVMAEKIRFVFEKHQFAIDGKTERVTVSIGVATWPTHGETYKQVLEVANKAEQEAKRTRNSVRVAGGR